MGVVHHLAALQILGAGIDGDEDKSDESKQVQAHVDLLAVLSSPYRMSPGGT
jgi:hypothetical protein